jgi:hypothetical protein
MKNEADVILRRVIIDYGRWYAYLHLEDANGKLILEEVFKQPFQLAQREVAEEAKDAWDATYQYLQDTVLWYATASEDGEDSESE